MKEISGRESLGKALTKADESNIRELRELYADYAQGRTELDAVIKSRLKTVLAPEDRIHVYPEDAEASRLIMKVRDERTGRQEFVYHVQRAYELLFRFAYLDNASSLRSAEVRTPVGTATHTLPDVSQALQDTVLCVMLRGALLPSMVIGKEIEDYASVTCPYALFRVKRDETRGEKDMRYLLDLDRSYFTPEAMDGKDLVFADPMNATGGSFITIVRYLERNGVKPRSIKFLNLIAALEGLLCVARSCPEAEVWTFWADPCLNSKAYILPGLGDAGDRLNGPDEKGKERNLVQLIADYGPDIVTLYRNQVREIEKTILP